MGRMSQLPSAAIAPGGILHAFLPDPFISQLDTLGRDSPRYLLILPLIVH